MPVYPIDRAEIRSEAKGLLRTASVPPLRFTLLFLAICLVLDEISAAMSYLLKDSHDIAPFGALSLSFSFAGILISLLSTVLLAGYVSYCLAIHRGAEMPYDSLFDAFPFAGKVILLELLQGLLIGLGLLLFIVPGVILGFAYVFALYHLCEDPDIGIVEALQRSREEMRGYKWQFFLLLLSFFPLLFLAGAVLALFETLLEGRFPDTLAGALLSALVSGVLDGAAQAYLLPYLELAQIGFYRRVTAERAENQNEDRP